MKATTEVLNAMRHIKLAALELRFRDKILALREVELALIWRQLLLGALNIFLLWMAPLLISVSSFAALTLWAGQTMAPGSVFTALALFRLLQEPLRSLPGFLMQLVQAWVSLKRLADFFTAHELQTVREQEAQGLADIFLPSCPVCFPSHGGKPSGGLRAACGKADGKRDTEEGAEVGSVMLHNAELCWHDAPQAQAQEAPSRESASRGRDASEPRRNRSPTTRGRSRSRHGGLPQGGTGEAREAEETRKAEEAREAEEARQAGTLTTQGRLRIEAGSLNLVIGRVGTGKSSLLAAVAGQLNCTSSTAAAASVASAAPNPTQVCAAAPSHGVLAAAARRYQGSSAAVASVLCVSGDVALCGQTPWIQNLSIRSNIVDFGRQAPGQCRWCGAAVASCPHPSHDAAVHADDMQAEDEARYARVVAACQLERDLEQLAAGDDTEIGEKGVTLSGGQKWRVALARAAFSGAPILALDDPLSALDAHVAAKLFDHLIVRFLHDRTRLVATNQVRLPSPPPAPTRGCCLSTCMVDAW